jgi:ornithine carbamoyltransferase
MTRHLLEIDDLSPTELRQVLAMATESAPPQVLAGKGAGLVFEKPSTRTRNSMEMAVVQLGGHPVYIRPEEVGIDTRETAEDVVRTLACYHSVVAARVFEHQKLERMAALNVVPVVNLLSDTAHPMQALADLLTIQQLFGLGDEGSPGDRPVVAYVGDANNVWRSLAIGCSMLGLESRVASPSGYGPNEGDLDRVKAAGSEPKVLARPEEAVEGADVVYTDVWTSMGQEDEKAERLAAFEGFGVDGDLVAGLTDRGVFLHCLPAHRGEEVTHEVMEGDRSQVWLQAENRMHAARGLLAWLLQQ